MKEDKLITRQIQALNTKNKIYKSAIRLLEEEGYQKNK